MVDPTPIRKDLFGTDKETDAPNDAFDASSVKNALAWGHKFYATVTNEGSFFILNRRLPGKVSFMTRKNFIDSLEDKQLIITHEGGKAKKVPFTELWLKDPSTDKNRYLGVVFDPSPTFDKKSNMLNLWDGFATKPKKGNSPLTLTYIKDIISSQDEIMNTYWIF